MRFFKSCMFYTYYISCNQCIPNDTINYVNMTRILLGIIMHVVLYQNYVMLKWYKYIVIILSNIQMWSKNYLVLSYMLCYFKLKLCNNDMNVIVILSCKDILYSCNCYMLRLYMSIFWYYHTWYVTLNLGYVGIWHEHYNDIFI